MLILISPAKKLDISPKNKIDKSTEISLANEYKKVAGVLKKKTVDELAEIMGISSPLAKSAHQRNSGLDSSDKIQAIRIFNGDVYTSLDTKSLNDDDLEFAQKHLRILSGLYGVLKPLDLIEAHRLEMGTKLYIDGLSLVEFWKKQVFKQINEALIQAKSPIINLASREYFAAVDDELVNSEVITPFFWDRSHGKYKAIGIYVKKARGKMVRFAIDNRITDANKLKEFDEDGYEFNQNLSSPNEWIFTRG